MLSCNHLPNQPRQRYGSLIGVESNLPGGNSVSLLGGAKKEEESQDETERNRNLEESRQLKRKVVRNPPSEYYELLNTLVSYAIAMVTLFTTNCEH